MNIIEALQDRENLSIISILTDGDGAPSISMDVKQRDALAMIVALRSIAEALEIDPAKIH